MDTINDRINAVVNKYSRNQKEFALSLKASQSRVSNIILHRNYPDYDFIEKLVKTYPQISIDWLILGNGPMLRTFENNNPQCCGCNRPIIIHLHKDSI